MSTDGPPLQHQRRVWGWLLASPAVAAGVVVSLYPLAYLLASSVSRSTLSQPFQEWIGGENYAEALQDPTFTGSLLRSVVFAVVTAGLQTALGVVTALLLRDIARGRSVLRALVLLPLVTPPVMAAVMWRLLLEPNGGLLNAVLREFGLIDAPLSLLGSQTWAIVMIGLADTWQWTPFVTILVLAALLGLPGELLEAAQVEGAGGWATFRYVILPLLAPTLLTVFLIKLILSFKVFDLVYILTFGGPGGASTTSGFLVFRTALREFDVGSAAAQTVLFLVVVTIVILPITRLVRRSHA
ncbi:MAG: carbohydrate ABC transporter permease [Kineosporiaceae bacterium]